MVDLVTDDFKKIYDFDTKKFSNKTPILIDFYADWCQPCVAISKILNDLEGKYPKVSFFKVNCEDEYELTKLFTVKNLPTLIFISTDGTYKQISGVIGAQKIENMLLEMCENKVTTI